VSVDWVDPARQAPPSRAKDILAAYWGEMSGTWIFLIVQHISGRWIDQSGDNGVPKFWAEIQEPQP
jgi:hypothetical protein